MRRTALFIVDDDRSLGKALKRLIFAKGFAAEHFDSARAFLDSVPSDQQGIAVVDLRGHAVTFDVRGKVK